MKEDRKVHREVEPQKVPVKKRLIQIEILIGILVLTILWLLPLILNINSLSWSLFGWSLYGSMILSPFYLTPLLVVFVWQTVIYKRLARLLFLAGSLVLAVLDVYFIYRLWTNSWVFP